MRAAQGPSPLAPTLATTGTTTSTISTTITCILAAAAAPPSRSMVLGSLSRALRRQLSTRRMLVMLAAWSLTQAALLVLHNRFLEATNGSSGPVLDLRPEGYTPADAVQLVQFVRSNPAGRTAYVLLEALDLALYAPCYAWLLSALLSMAASVAPVEALKNLNLLPWVAAAVDAVENICTLCMLLAPPAAAAHLVDGLAPYLAAASRAKWMLIYATVCVLVGGGCYCLAVAGGLAGKQRRRPTGGTTRGAAAAAAGSSSSRQRRGGRAR